jgi:rod shape determining protein RodA
MLRIDRRLLAHFEWPLAILTLLLLGCGLLSILSATYDGVHSLSSFVIRQGTWMALGAVVLLAAMSIDYRTLLRHGYAVYAVVLLGLVLVPIVGVSGGGARRWLSLGPMSIQPSELMKVALILVLARQLHRWAGERRLAIRRIAPPLLLLAPAAYLVLRQPDLGTVIVLALASFTVLLFAGLPLRLVVIALLVIGPALPSAWNHLKPYQRQRLVSFFNPQADPLGAGYHVRQSQIAIGSGMVRGKGYLKGTQNKLNFLPEQHTDFIFSVYAEEWGFLGSAALLSLYIALILRGAVIATRARDNAGALLAAGLTAVIFWQAAINVAMTSGALPVVGITLPFLSYGGSSILALMASIGLIMNVSMRRFTF